MQVHAYIKGNVVGVFYRKFAKQEADRVGVTGWIRNVYNKPEIFGDRSGVEMVIQGSKEHVDEMITWCTKGSPMAHVATVDVHEEHIDERFESFEVKPSDF